MKDNCSNTRKYFGMKILPMEKKVSIEICSQKCFQINLLPKVEKKVSIEICFQKCFQMNLLPKVKKKVSIEICSQKCFQTNLLPKVLPKPFAPKSASKPNCSQIISYAFFQKFLQGYVHIGLQESQ